MVSGSLPLSVVRKVVVIGGGLAGLCAALEAAKVPDTEVVILEKNDKPGGNSAKVSTTRGTPRHGV